MKTDNELIAEFMGVRFKPRPLDGRKLWYIRPISTKSCKQPKCLTEDLKYHTSWDWLMPVVEKIKKMEHNPDEMFMGTTMDRHLHFIAVTQKPITTPIDFMFEEIIEFIKWYNQVTPK